MGELDGLSGFGEGTLIDIRGLSVALAEVVEGISVGGENGVAVLAFVGAELREGALRIDGEGSGRSRDIFPYIPRDRGGMVLAERVLIALVVFVKDGPVRIDGQGLEGHRGDQARRLARQVGRIQLRRTGETVEAAAHQGAVVSAEEHRAVREDGQRGLIAGQGSDLPGFPAFGRRGEDILRILPIGSEEEPFSVRRPHGLRFIGGIGRHLQGDTAGGGHGINVSFIAERQGLAIRRQGVFPDPGRAFPREEACGGKQPGGEKEGFAARHFLFRFIR